MVPDALNRELQTRGLVILGIGRHRTDPDVLFVYLHGNQGQWVEGQALELVAEVPGVAAVTESIQSPTILLVRTDPAHESS